MDRFWLLTWTTYGSWLPGDDRGFVSNVDRGDGKGERRNVPGTQPAAAMRGLTIMAQAALSCPPVELRQQHAAALISQLSETAKHRGWQILAAAVMWNHVHVVVGVPGDPQPDSILRDLKSYASRRLNKEFERPRSGTWWTESGSRRKLPDETAIKLAMAYVEQQPNSLAVWVDLRSEAEHNRS